MDVLNVAYDTPPKVEEAPPRVVLFETRGSYLLFDGNSLLLASVTAREAAGLKGRAIPRDGLLGCRWAPVWAMPRRKVAKLVLNITHSCNLNCDYCFVTKDGTSMTARVIEAAAARFKPRTICLFGGEPLMDLAACRRAVATFPEVMEWRMTTNGTLVTDAAAAFLSEHRFRLIVSLDGPREIHDIHRQHYTETMRGLDALAARRVPVLLRATFGEEGRLTERAEFFDALRKDGLAHSYSIEPRDDLAIAPDYGPLVDWFVAGGATAPLRPLSVFLDRVLRGKPHSRNCGAGNAYITIGPDGRIFACHREEDTAVGDIVAGFDGRRDAWLDKPLRTGCRDCIWRCLCGGGCWQARSCAARRALFPFVLWLAASLRKKEQHEVV